MVTISVSLVKNYRMEAAFLFSNRERMLPRGFFWDACFRAPTSGPELRGQSGAKKRARYSPIQP